MASSTLSLPAAPVLTGDTRPIDTQAHDARWPLGPPPVPAYRCWECGLYGMRPRSCCGRRARRVPAPYYVAIGSPALSAPDFSVILLTKNDLPRARRAVESLRRARDQHSVEFVFVDGGSTDGSLNYFRDLARTEAVQLVVTHPEEPFVSSRNANRGAEAAAGRFLIFARDDVESCDGDLFARLGRVLADPRVGVVGASAEGSREAHEAVDPAAGQVWSVAPVPACLWGIRAAVFAELDGLDQGFSEEGGAEIDLQYRAIRRNYRLAAIHSRIGQNGLLSTNGVSRSRWERMSERFAAKHVCPLVTGGEWYAPFLSHTYPRVSIAMACRNYGRFLPRALDSILGSYLPAGSTLQLVVVNDASSDETAGILEQYRLRYPDSITVLHRPTSHGPAPAKNQAIDRCIGEYVALLDADDEFLEYKLWHSLETLEGSGAEFLYHDFIEVSADGRQQWYRIGRWNLKRWRTGTRLPPGCWVFRNGLVRFCERQITGEDPDFLRRHWHRLRTIYLPEALTRYHMHGTGLSTRAMCKVVTGQLKGLAYADVRTCSDV